MDIEDYLDYDTAYELKKIVEGPDRPKKPKEPRYCLVCRGFEEGSDEPGIGTCYIDGQAMEYIPFDATIMKKKATVCEHYEPKSDPAGIVKYWVKKYPCFKGIKVV